MGGRPLIASAVAAIAIALIAAPAAEASFHLIKVREVFPGTAARPDSGYVELQMYASGQYLVNFGQLEVLNSVGEVKSQFSPSSSVPNFANQSTVLIADTEFTSQFPGVTSDFTDAELNLSAAGGAVCWPQTEPPFDDCASWGNFSGQASLPSPGDTSPAAPSGVPNGMALRRSISANCPTFLENADDTNDSAADFSLQTPNPRNNASPIVESACTLPTVAIDTGPAKATNSQSASFTYHSNPASGTSFECKLDVEAFAACEPSGISYAGPLSEGSHTFQVRAKNVSGTGIPTVYTWTVDVTPPVATIDGPKPANPGPGASTSFFFHSNENGSKFQCSLVLVGKPDSFAVCSSGKTYSNLANGEYVFKVSATDPAGNQGAPESFIWEVDNSLLDTTPPETTIDSKPPDPSGSSTAAFIYASNEAGSTFKCALDSAPFADCPATGISYSGLADGSHTFRVQAIDPSDNVDPTPAGYTFDVEVQGPPIPPPVLPPPPSHPNTTISTKLSAKTHDRTPTFRFGSDETGSSFQCQVDGKPFKLCRSPFTTKSLSFGRHTVKIRAVVGGLTDPTPAKFSFKIVRR